MSLFSSRVDQAQARLVAAGSVLLASAFAVGCGAGYRPVVTPINPTGPASQPASYAVVVSAPSGTTAGQASIVDYAGDTIVAQAPIGPGPLSFTLDETGGNGYTVNSDGTLTNFPVSSSLQAKNVQYTTLPTTAKVVNLYSPSTGLWAADQDGDVTDVLTGSPLKLQLSIPGTAAPILTVGPGVVGQRNYTITQNIVDPTSVACNTAPASVGSVGAAEALETNSFTVSATIPVGRCPVFAVETPDARRVFVLNRGDDTISVINSQINALDDCTPFLNQSGQLVTCHPTLPLSTGAGLTGAGVPATAGPVYAEYNAATSQLVVADYDGNAISVIDVSLDQYGNDSPTFGTTYTIPVGANPASVTALNDGSRAYTANQADGTVSIVNLTSHTLIKTLPVNGHPRTVVSTQNSLYGKVYVASPDSPYLTIVRTDQDIIDTTVLLQGNIVDVRTSTQSGSQGNFVNVSRRPGFGQPCYLPGATYTASFAACATLPGW